MGDLSLYSLGYHSNSKSSVGPTVFLLLDPSLYSSSNSEQQTHRLQQLQQALVYLMDTPGLLPDNLQVGIGQVAQTSPNLNETMSELLIVPTAMLGSVSNETIPHSV
ncbi:hypothetical protein [Psychrobacter sp.]|uniref:hypothetical protein n=1 Tax=Psychrobacter sp. TaxID=56811 RepID=UPI0025D02FC8|nr:hypothetical protein [Psychrobacter sp.]